MIVGVVGPNLEAMIRLHVEDGQGQTQMFDLKIDTGFSEFISLPVATIATLGLPAISRELVELADGSTVSVNVHFGVVIWDGRARKVSVHGLGKEQLIGMRMLASHDLAIRVSDGGTVSITLTL